MRYSALMTDLYELTMLAGYFDGGMHDRTAVFDLFFRKAPFQGSYAVFAGLAPALEYLEASSFSGPWCGFCGRADWTPAHLTWSCRRTP